MRPTHLTWPWRLTCLLGVLALAGPAKAIDPALLPPDTEAVVTINLRQMLTSDLAKAHPDVVAQLKGFIDNQFGDFGVEGYLQKLDFDLFRDLDSITITTTGANKLPDFLLIEGKFHAERLQATGAEASREHEDHLKVVQIAGLTAYEVRVDPMENPVYAGLVGKNKFIATFHKDAYADAVTRIKNVEANTKPAPRESKLRKELRDVLAVTGGKTSLTIVSTGSALARLSQEAPVPNIKDLGDVLQGISALNVSLTLGKNLNFEVVVNSKDKMGADKITGLADLGVAGAKLMLKSRADTDAKIAPALDIVNTLRVVREENSVILRGEIAAPVLGKLLENLPK